jgi:hypothetical protein
MSVYVDDMQADYKGMKMCHMIADTNAELMAMVDKIGVQRKWIQKAGTYKEHFDICLSKRKLAVTAGALEITQQQLGRMLIDRQRDGQATLRLPNSCLTGASNESRAVSLTPEGSSHTPESGRRSQ